MLIWTLNWYLQGGVTIVCLSTGRLELKQRQRKAVRQLPHNKACYPRNQSQEKKGGNLSPANKEIYGSFSKYRFHYEGSITEKRRFNFDSLHFLQVAGASFSKFESKTQGSLISEKGQLGDFLSTELLRCKFKIFTGFFGKNEFRLKYSGSALVEGHHLGDPGSVGALVVGDESEAVLPPPLQLLVGLEIDDLRDLQGADRGEGGEVRERDGLG